MKDYGVSEVAKILSISRQYVHALIKKGKLEVSSSRRITSKSLRLYKAFHNGPGRIPRRCEPCSHPKKRCRCCKRYLCFNDFTTRNKATNKTQYDCKDCKAKRKREVEADKKCALDKNAPQRIAPGEKCAPQLY